MTFKSECIDAFKNLLSTKHEAIKNFPGCESLEILQDKNDQRIFFTVSTWTTEGDLEKYRNSMLFKETWKQTKILFDDRPNAWSTQQLDFTAQS